LAQDGVVAAPDAARMIGSGTDGLLAIAAPRIHADLGL
jgi:hypothetical protein